MLAETVPPTCQSVGSEESEAHGEQREGVDEVNTEVENSLEHYYHKAELDRERQTDRDSKGSKNIHFIVHWLEGECVWFLSQQPQTHVERPRDSAHGWRGDYSACVCVLTRVNTR